MTEEPAHIFTRPEGLLAHYTDAAAAFEHILPEQRLRLSPYYRMRDPVEKQDVLPTFTYWGDRPGAEAAAFAAMADLKTARDAMRVLAFSRNAGDGTGLRHAAFDCCWARPRMWEQYGNNHAGACLLFDGARLEAILRNDLGDERLSIGNVKYDREAMAASPLQHVNDERVFDPEQRRKAVADHLDRHREDFFFLKSDDFETEAEYRVVLNTDHASPGTRQISRGSPTSRTVTRLSLSCWGGTSPNGRGVECVSCATTRESRCCACGGNVGVPSCSAPASRNWRSNRPGSGPGGRSPRPRRRSVRTGSAYATSCFRQPLCAPRFRRLACLGTLSLARWSMRGLRRRVQRCLLGCRQGARGRLPVRRGRRVRPPRPRR
jgi:hypothetical protein